MSDTPEVVKIGAQLADLPYAVESLYVELQVNQFATVRCGVMPTNGALAQRVMSSQVTASIAALQQKRINNVFPQPNFNLTCQDGIGGEMQFQGFVAAPGLELSKYKVGANISAVARDSITEALDLSIYDLSVKPERAEQKIITPESKAAEGFKKGDLKVALQNATEALIDLADVVIDAQPDPTARQLLAIQHLMNEDLPLQVWREILDNTGSLQFNTWKAFFGAFGFAAEHAGRVLCRLLQQQASGFWSAVRATMGHFPMTYIPATSGAGKFVRAGVKVGPPTGALQLNGAQVTVQDGSRGAAPHGGVVMRGPAAPAERQEAKQSDGQVVAFYPETLRIGLIESIPAPAWLYMDGDGRPSFLVAQPEVSKDGINLGIDRLREINDGLADSNEKLNLGAGGIMTEMCEEISKDIELADSTSSVMVPLNFRLNDLIGMRLDITVGKEDGGRFVGFLTGITHQVDLREGKELDSHTTLRFSHCIYS